jgi:hypothetical protein
MHRRNPVNTPHPVLPRLRCSVRSDAQPHAQIPDTPSIASLTLNTPHPVSPVPQAVCTAIGVAGWPAYGAATQRAGPDPEALVSLGVAAVNTMEACSKAVARAAAAETGPAPLGACLTGGWGS